MTNSYLSAIAAALCLMAGPALAQEGEPAAAEQPAAEASGAAPGDAPVDPVVATVNGADILLSDVQAAGAELPAEYQNMPPQLLFPTLLDRVIDGHLLAAAATESGIAEEDSVQRDIERVRRQVLGQAYILDAIEAATTEEALEARYEAIKDEPDFAFEERKTRHILVESEDQAREIIAELDGGAEFAELAQERSTGPSASDGGDLGYIRRDSVVPSFGEAAFTLEVGAYTKEPVESQFGWHVITVEDVRSTTPSLEETEGQLRQEIARDTVMQVVNDLREDAEIERFNMDGTPITEDEPAEGGDGAADQGDAAQ